MSLISIRNWFRPPRHVLTIFAGVAIVSACALAWLAWLLLEQDKAVESQRRQERVELAADRAVPVMQRALEDLAQKAVPRPAGLLYYPSPAELAEAPAETFAAGEQLEFTRQDPAAAARIYASLATAHDPAVRAGALTRLARVRRKMGVYQEALDAYSRLAGIGAQVGGIPAPLLAREGRATVLEQMGRKAELREEAAALDRDLRGGRWQLTKSAYAFYSGQAHGWLGGSATDDRDAIARAEAFAWAEQNQGASRRILNAGGSPALVIRTGNKVAIEGPKYLASLCRDAIPGADLQFTLSDPEGHAFMGAGSSRVPRAVRTAAATRLPWTLDVFAPATMAATSPRRQLLLWVFAVLGIVLATGAYFIARAIARELRVGRLQSDFVAAVSHEFRSPLSSLCQISEMLARDRFSSEEQRRRSYDVLAREAERLRRLVEGLLDFGRFEAGAATYRFERIDAGQFIRATIAEFQERLDGYRIELEIPAGEILIRADREALGRALWNLLENAVKYSPACRTVWVEVEQDGEQVRVTVRDNGLGIPAREQREIFNKFVRGADPKTLRIKGTGIGLAMVRHIVEAHGGEIRVASEPGRGSRFTMVLYA